MWPGQQFHVDLVTFTREILNGKLHFLCSVKAYSSELTLVINKCLGERVFPDDLKLADVRIIFKKQKQPFRDVFRKRCSENMQQTYRRTPLPKYIFAKVKSNSYWNRTSACSLVNLLDIFRTPFPKNTSEGLLLKKEGSLRKENY